MKVFLSAHFYWKIKIKIKIAFNGEERKVGVVLFFGEGSSSQAVAGYNDPQDGCHTHRFLPAMVKLDLIICSSVDKIKI